MIGRAVMNACVASEVQRQDDRVEVSSPSIALHRFREGVSTRSVKRFGAVAASLAERCPASGDGRGGDLRIQRVAVGTAEATVEDDGTWEF